MRQKNGHKMVTIGRKPLCHNASMRFDSPHHCRPSGYELVQKSMQQKTPDTTL